MKQQLSRGKEFQSVALLRERVGGLVTLSNLAADIQVSPKTAASCLEVLERMYLVFAVRPFTRSLPRAVLKPPKVYFFDTGDPLVDEGERFENIVAAPAKAGIQTSNGDSIMGPLII